MDVRNTAQQAPPATSPGMDHGEEMIADVDEPPDESSWSPTKLKFEYLKAQPQMQRRESMLTRQLHSETEHTDEEPMPMPARALSTQSTWSNPSTASMAELTSDDGRSNTSPAISPPLGPAHNTAPVHDRPLEPRVRIVGQDHVAPSSEKDGNSEKSVEENLGRKRHISFACRGKEESKAPPPPTSEPKTSESSSPPKRKCTLKFVCPTRSGSETKTSDKPPTKRAVSPPPPSKRPSMPSRHRGSDSTITHTSPKNNRKSSVAAATTPAPEPLQENQSTQARRYSNESSDDEGKEATRFHEFGTSEDEPEEWVQESTCHRSRLTVNDTLQKENIIRKTCEEVEEEAIEEEEEDDLEDELAAVEGMDDDDENDNGIDEEEESDEGFHSDDEGGFASSDDEDDSDSDYEWWRPGGASTAATSVDHLDRLAIINAQQPLASSVGSASSAQVSPRASKVNLRTSASKQGQTPAMPIRRSGSPDLPDSTDFVCGTLDEDRPIEQAYINRKKMKDAAKRPVRPQDIDPSFPTSDPEMDEEDDDDVDEAQESNAEDEGLMHGAIDDVDGVDAAPTPRPRGRSNRSPPPPARLRSPPPAKHVSTARSPPPAKHVSTVRSPPPAGKRVSIARSPPPTKRTRSPAPKKLFGHSPPNRMKSPAPVKRMTSPPNSPTDTNAPLSAAPHLAERPALTHTASLPRGGPITLSKLAIFSHDEVETSDNGFATEVPKRGAIDIVKGVEWKRQRRKEKLHQKLCAKAAAKGEKSHKVKPGKGAERMREVGLQLQEYQGKAEHILSL